MNRDLRSRGATFLQQISDLVWHCEQRKKIEGPHIVHEFHAEKKLISSCLFLRPRTKRILVLFSQGPAGSTDGIDL